MIDEDRGKDSSTNHLTSKSNSIRAYVSDLICRASDEEDFDARKILEENPEVQNHRSLVLDLAYEEYCQKVESGDDVKQSSFAKRFPEYEESLLRVLQVHQYLEKTEKSKAKPKVEWPKPGDVFGEYRLLELIGRGTFAFVFIAEQLNVAGRKVVLKITRDALDEVETLGRLDHPNIVQIYTVESDVDGFTAICMPLISQVTLFDLLAELHGGGVQPQHSVDFAEALEACLNERQEVAVERESLRIRLNGPFVDAVIRVGIDIANALTYSHERGFLHCDIKPTNILISPVGRSMLFDFNLSAKSNSKTGRIGGTLPYMPPEQLQALVDNNYDFEATRAVDLFSFGVTLYQFLTGKLPFGDIPEATTQKEAAKILLERQRSTKVSFEGVKGLNKSLKKIIEQCLEFKHQHRPKTAERVAKQLEEENSKTKRTRRWVIKNPVKSLTAVLLLAIALTGAVYGLSHWSQAPSQQTLGLVEKAKEYITTGKKFEDQNNFDEATYYFYQASKIADFDPDVRFQSLAHLTIVYARNGKYEDAARTLSILKERYPEHTRIVSSLELSVLNCVPRIDNETWTKGYHIYNRYSRKDSMANLDDYNNYIAILFRFRTKPRGHGAPAPVLTDIVAELKTLLNKNPEHPFANLLMHRVIRQQAIYGETDITNYSYLDKANELLDDFPSMIIYLFAKEANRINNGASQNEFRRLLDRFAACGGLKQAAISAISKIENRNIQDLIMDEVQEIEFQPCDEDRFEFYCVANPLLDYDFYP